VIVLCFLDFTCKFFDNLDLAGFLVEVDCYQVPQGEGADRGSANRRLPKLRENALGRLGGSNNIEVPRLALPHFVRRAALGMTDGEGVADAEKGRSSELGRLQLCLIGYCPLLLCFLNFTRKLFDGLDLAGFIVEVECCQRLQGAPA